MKRDVRAGKDWPCGWDEHRIEQLKRMARLPFREKLRWLEEAHRLVLAMGGGKAARKRR